MADFLCYSDMPKKHPSDPSLVRHVPAREPKKVTFMNHFENVHVYVVAARLGSNGGRGVTFRSECEEDEEVGRGNQ